MKENDFTLKKTRSRRYPAETITNADYTDDIVLLANTPTQAKSCLHNLEQAARGLSLQVNADKIEYMCFNQKGYISVLNNCCLKFVYKFTYLSSDVNMCLVKAWTAIDRLSIVWKSNLFNKIKRDFFQVAVVSNLLYECIAWTLIKCKEKKLNLTRMLQAILNKSWNQHPIKQQLYSHSPPITKTIKIR